ncbi:MAG TPA: ATP-binding domain-containing protein, partial [Candidatus Paceibacterota bacterium]
MLQATTLPLSISYRCPVEVVKLAQNIVPQIEPSATAPSGTVRYIKQKDFLTTVEVGDMVVCRTNAPLVEPAFMVIRSGRKAVIRGADIGKTLVNFVERFNAPDISMLEILMAEYVEKEMRRLLDKGKELQADMLLDKMTTVQTVARECTTVEEIVTKISILFADTQNGVVFSSIHRAKGLEADRVFILHPELLPHPKAQQDWEKQQELNCLYVAVTRSKSELYFVREV